MIKCSEMDSFTHAIGHDDQDCIGAFVQFIYPFGSPQSFKSESDQPDFLLVIRSKSPHPKSSQCFMAKYTVQRGKQWVSSGLISSKPGAGV